MIAGESGIERDSTHTHRPRRAQGTKCRQRRKPFLLWTLRCPLEGPSAGVVVVLVRLLFDELNGVAACVVKDGHDSGADVGRRLREYHAVAGQPGVLGLDVVGRLSERDAVFDKSIPICAVLLGSGLAEKRSRSPCRRRSPTWRGGRSGRVSGRWRGRNRTPRGFCGPEPGSPDPISRWSVECALR